MPWFRVTEFNGLVSTKSQVVPGFFNVRIFYSGLDTVDLHYHTKRTFMYTNFGPNRRPPTAKERSIRFKYGSLFVFAALCAITLGVLYNNQNIELKKIEGIKQRIDSSFIKLDYIESYVDDDGDTVEVSTEKKIEQMTEDAFRYREMHDDLFELRSTEARYEMALEYYADPLMHQEYRERTGSNFKSKYTETQRKGIVEKIRKEVSSFNSIIAYRDAYDWYRAINPTAISEIELFLYFTE